MQDLKQSPGEQVAKKAAQEQGTPAAAPQSSTHMPVILKQAPPAGETDAKGSSIWIRL